MKHRYEIIGLAPAVLLACSRPGPAPAPAGSVEHDASPSVQAPTAASVAMSAAAPAARHKASPPGPLVLLKGGKFKMGTDGVGPGTEDSQPARWVTLPSFRLDIGEVTVSAYQACVSAGACTEPQKPANPGRERCTWSFPELDELPINCVVWSQAEAYCKWAGKELPSEEMWEYAAAGQVGRDFPWGWGIPGRDWGEPPDFEQYVSRCLRERLCSRTLPGGRVEYCSQLCPPGSAPKGNTPAGIQDMAGNVAEWTASFFCPHDKPKCETKERTVRGGLTSGGHGAWTRRRSGLEPNSTMENLGFRCAQRVGENEDVSKAKMP